MIVSELFAHPLFLLVMLLLAGAAAAFVVVPLAGRGSTAHRLRRKQRALDALREELGDAEYRRRREALQAGARDAPEAPRSPVLIALLAAGLPAATVALYLAVGTPGGLSPSSPEHADLRALLGDLTDRVKHQPDDIDAWNRIGLLWKNMEQFAPAEAAFRRVLYYDPGNVFATVELAETLLFASGQRRFPEEARALVEDVLARNPEHQKALWLAGFDALERGDNVRAIGLWTRLEQLLPPASSVRAQLAAQLQRAGAEMPDDAIHAGLTGADRPAADSDSAAGARLEIDVDVDPALAAALDGSETVFVFARAINGPPAPLAVERLTAAELPARVTLDRTDAMAEGLTLDDFPEVEVVARVSRGGGVQARPGDLEGRSAPVVIAQTGKLTLSITRRID